MTLGTVLYGIAALAIAGVILAAATKPFIKEDVMSVTVTEKGERCKSRDSCKYMFYTDKGVFQNTDSIINWKWDSADFYNDIKVGKTYDFRVSGYRIAPVLSWFPNVVEYKEVK